MEFKDYYKALGIERSATQDEVKRAFRTLARKYHPDVSKEADAEAKFKEVSEAYDVLGDPEKRAAYDELGKGPPPGQQYRPPPDWDAGFEFSGAPDGTGRENSEFFEAIFGRAGRRGQQPHDRAAFKARGEDHHARIQIDLRDAFEGATRQITLRMPEIDAEGHVRVRPHTLNVTIPKGVTEGQHIRLKGQGAPGIGGMPAGDLYLEIAFNADPLYRVAGRDLYIELPVAPWEAALGASIRTPTPAGAIMLKVPPNSFSGRELRVKGRGLPGPEPGDLYAVLKIVLPPADTEAAKKAYDNMRQALDFDPRAKLGGWTT